jgi:selenium-binding protein 1
MLGPTFYHTLAGAIAAVPERLPCVAAFDLAGQAKNTMAVIDAGPSWPDFGEVVGWSELPNAGKELHTSAGTPAPALCATTAPRPPLERRYLIVQASARRGPTCWTSNPAPTPLSPAPYT